MNQTEEPGASKTSRPNAESVYGAFTNAFDQLGRAMAPPENVEHHFREARKHVLLGLRELIDHRIQRMSRGETKGTRIVVD
jgi:hypothetical protein